MDFHIRWHEVCVSFQPRHDGVAGRTDRRVCDEEHESILRRKERRNRRRQVDRCGNEEKTMKRRILTVVALAFAGLFITETSRAGIANSAHDFSTNGWANGEICLPCHAPHNNNSGTNNLTSTLWNHKLSAVQNYNMYASPTMTKFSVSIQSQPSAGSKTCLSCHDGTVAVDSFGANTGTHFVQAVNNTGTDLSNDHPISFIYDSGLASRSGGTLQNPSSALSGLAGGGTIANDMLINGMLECSSCHDVHNQYNSPKYMLKRSNSGSGLCLTCHIK
jgi:predicted CXXCH cytochrome family protein